MVVSWVDGWDIGFCVGVEGVVVVILVIVVVVVIVRINFDNSM